MANIKIHKDYCEINEEEDFSFLWALDKELSYKIQGSEHTRAYKGYTTKDGTFVQWDGFNHLMNEKLKFPIGLLTRVKEFYIKNKKIVSAVIDTREAKSESKPINIFPRLNELGRPPYHYQIEAAEAAKNNDRGILRIATGGGKSILASLITAQFGKKTILYVIGCDLLYQMHKLFSSIFSDIKIGLIGDGNCEIGDINIASVWTIGQALGLKKNEIIEDSIDDEKKINPDKYSDVRELLSLAKVHIFDECHLAACNTIQEICKNIDPEHIYGMSASPWRDDGADLLIESVLGRNIIDVSASYLIDNGFLVQPNIKFIKVPAYPEKLTKQYQTIYKKYIVENPIRNGIVVRGAIALVEQGYQTLVLYNSVAHGAFLASEISKYTPCILLSGKDSSDVREKAKQQLEKGEIRCIIASKIFDIGVDLPSLSGLVIASGGKSSVRALQRIGRVIRKFEGKSQAAIIDFYDQAHFLKDHSKERFKIYSTEKRFNVIWPK